jgi:hypothetical protein
MFAPGATAPATSISSSTSPSALSGIGGAVGSAIDGDAGDVGRGDAERLEVVGDVGLVVAAAELDDADGLAGSVTPVGKL